MLSLADYFANNFLKDNEIFQMYGVLKVGSVSLKRGSLDTRFTITDFKNNIEVFYTGAMKFEFKEGETIVITGYCPDIKNKNKVICVDYMTKHALEVENWEGNNSLVLPCH